MADEPMVSDDETKPAVVAESAPDPKEALADRICALLSDLLRNGPVSRQTDLWNHFHTTIIPAFKADVLKEL